MTKKIEKKATKKVAKKKEVGFTVELGGYSNSWAAEKAAGEFLHPDIFRYQAVFFPLPSNFGIAAKIVKATPFELKTLTNPLELYGVRLVIQTAGDAKKVEDWKKNLMARLRTKVIG